MNTIIHKEQTACISINPSQDFSWLSDETDARFDKIKADSYQRFEALIQRGYRTFLCGIDNNFDIICVETLSELKKKYNFIKTIGVLPYRNREANWVDKERIKYRRTLAKVDEFRCIYDRYMGEECVLERNWFMVNNSSILIALYNGLSGGRKSIIDYALRQGLEVTILHSQ
ncbi:MAG: DUF1273 domain-containing protein [Clostridiales bacterium]|nr:DUF1273 domain-containing protein [Clostridiales bacterium]